MEARFDQIEKRSWTEIDLNHLAENYRIYKGTLPQDTEIMAVVKADAYGCGDSQVAKILEAEGVRLFAVSNIYEAVALRDSGVLGEILIFGYTSPTMASVLLEKNIIQTLVSEEHAEAMLATGKKLRVQFAIDTGMNRIGLDADNPEHCEEIIRFYSSRLDVTGIFTHLCVADSEAADDVKFTEEQISKFKSVYEKTKDLNFSFTHLYNSAGGLYHFNKDGTPAELNKIVRLGIVLYGLKPDIKNLLPHGIRPVLSWKTVVSVVKTVRAGEYIGYGRSYRAENDRIIATLATGYADGYSRALSNKGFVLINGKRAPIVGRVCMDQMTVDVTDIQDVKMGDTATLLGKDGEEQITADDMGELIGTIGYEIVCGISKRPQRFYII